MPKSDQGLDIKRYSVVPRTLLLVFKGQDVLLIKGSEKKNIWPQKYNGLGGHVERGEDILESSYRELAEESGQANIDLRLCGIVMVDVEPRRGVLLFIFCGEYAGEVLSDSDEGILEWVPVSSIDQINIVEDLRVFIPRAYDWNPGDGVFSGLNYYDQTGTLKTKIFS
ncbi:MAG: NUDIX domain-containing protein [Anaerolineaceae bacterium]|nr:NUDIX domain-containing protein [Anaerolineaceae bacterium]